MYALANVESPTANIELCSVLVKFPFTVEFKIDSVTIGYNAIFGNSITYSIDIDAVKTRRSRVDTSVT